MLSKTGGCYAEQTVSWQWTGAHVHCTPRRKCCCHRPCRHTSLNSERRPPLSALVVTHTCAIRAALIERLLNSVTSKAVTSQDHPLWLDITCSAAAYV